MMSFIYALTDPRVGSVRYVGKTKRKLESRLSQHLYLCSKRRNRLYNWLLSLKRDGVRPVIAQLQTCEGEDWRGAERQWIAHFKALGANLVNSSEGGQGPSGIKRPDLIESNRIRFTGRKLTPAHRSRVIATLVHAHSREVVVLRAATHVGKKRGQSTLEKMSRARVENGTTEAQMAAVYKMHEGNRGRQRSEETKQKIAAAVKLFHARKKVQP